MAVFLQRKGLAADTQVSLAILTKDNTTSAIEDAVKAPIVLEAWEVFLAILSGEIAGNVMNELLEEKGEVPHD